VKTLHVRPARETFSNLLPVLSFVLRYIASKVRYSAPSNATVDE